MDEPGSDAERLSDDLRTDYPGRAPHNETLTVHRKIFTFREVNRPVVRIPVSRAAAR
jgi:hypothetical protein